MHLRDAMLTELDLEMATTRRVLERVPADAAGWRPHAKSYPIDQLAGHIADLPFFAVSIATSDEFDFTTSGFKGTRLESREQILDYFDGRAREAREAIAAMSDGEFEREYRLRAGKHVMAAGPKALMLRTLFLNHLIHHRAQLTVYLRLRDLPVPGVYGPSADEAATAVR